MMSPKFAGVAAFLQKRIKHCLIMDFEEKSAVFLNWTFFRISAHCANAHTERFDWVNKFWISSWHLDSGNWTAQPAEHYVGRCPRGRSVLKVPIPVKFLNFFPKAAQFNSRGSPIIFGHFIWNCKKSFSIFYHFAYLTSQKKNYKHGESRHHPGHCSNYRFHLGFLNLANLPSHL